MVYFGILTPQQQQIKIAEHKSFGGVGVERGSSFLSSERQMVAEQHLEPYNSLQHQERHFNHEFFSDGNQQLGLRRLMQVDKAKIFKIVQSLRKFDNCIIRHLNKYRNHTNTFSSADRANNIYGMHFPNISQHFSGLMKIIYCKRTKMVSVSFHFLDRNGQYLRISDPHLFFQVYRTIFLCTQAHQNSLKVLFHPQNGSISLQICYYALDGSSIIEDLDQGFLYPSKNVIIDLYKIFIQRFVPLFQKAFRINVPIEARGEGEQTIKLFDNMQRYLKMMTTKVNLSSGRISSQEARMSQLKQRQQSTAKLFERRVKLDEQLLKPFGLFGNFKVKPDKKSSKGTHSFHISQSEEKQLISVLSLEDHKASQFQMNSHLNIVNYIRVNEPQRLNTHPLSVGGFSQLESSEVPFWYIDSYRTKDEVNQNPRTMQKKYMAIKRQNRPHGKNMHELKILTEMRNGINNLFPKYYIPLNMSNHDIHKNPLIMMDFLSYGNLNQYLCNRKKNVSLLSKIYLLFSVSMALRYLQTYKIVHLDLKPNNVMIASGLLVKLIDFGEAFNQEVWKDEEKAYRPGMTMPYCCPQFVTGIKEGFNNKADVYSLGVMMFEVLYGKVPFQKRQNWLCSAEKYDCYGDPDVIRLLNCVISRCLSRNPEHRPQLDWVSVILRLSLQVII